MIWDLLTESTFDSHFSDPDLQIVTLLLDENIITELKNQNPQLLSFLHSHKAAFLQELLTYATTMPSPSAGHARCHQLPYISSELLALDSPLILDEFFPPEDGHNPWWTQLLQFLSTEAADNEVLMGYFQKVVANLQNARPARTTVVVSRHLEEFMGRVRSGSVVDVLKKGLVLVGCEEGAALGEREGLVDRLVRVLAEGDVQEQAAASEILSELIGKFQASSSGDQLIARLLASPQLQAILSQSNRQPIDSFLSNLLKKHIQTTVNEHDQTVSLLPLPASLLIQAQSYILRESQLLQQSTPNSYLRNQSGKTVRKLAKRILPMLQLIALGLQCGLPVGTAQIVTQLWGLVALFPFNDILQVSVKRVFSGILASNNREVLLHQYEAYLLGLAQIDEQMFRPFIFGVWKLAKLHPTATADAELLQTFGKFVSEKLEPLMKYEIVAKGGSHGSGKKLVVDEEDAAANEIEGRVQWRVDSPAKIEAKTVEKEQKQQETKEEKEEKPEKSAKTQPQSQKTGKQQNPFDFFSGWQQPQPAPKQDLFGDFTSFF